MPNMDTKNNRIKVLFLIHTLQIGGAEKVLVDLVNAMDKNRYEVTVMTVCDFGDFRNSLNDDIKYESIFKFKILKKIMPRKKYGQTIGASARKSSIKTIAINNYKRFWRNANLDKFYKKHIKEKYDVEVAFLEGIPAKIISHSSNDKSRKYVWLHVDLINENKSDAFFNSIKEQKDTYEKFDEIICVSEVVKDRFLEKMGIEKTDRVSVLYNPINSKAINKKADEYNVQNDKFTFCTIGRLSRQKGYDRLLNVVEKLNNEGLIFDVQIIGVGADEYKLKKQAEVQDIRNVHFLGYKNNPYPYIRESDAFVCSSRAEGFSTVVSEAIVLQKPIIATNCSGMKEMLGAQSEYGLVCDNSEKALYEAMKTFLVDKKTYKHYEKMIKERSQFFDFEGAVKKIEHKLEG